MNKVALVFHENCCDPKIFLFDEKSNEHELCKLANGYVGNVDYGDDNNPNQEMAYDKLNEEILPKTECRGLSVENEIIVAIYSIGFFSG